MSMDDNIPDAGIDGSKPDPADSPIKADLNSIKEQRDDALADLTSARQELQDVRSTMNDVLSQVSSEIKALEQEKEALLSDLAASRGELEEARTRAKDVLSQTAWEIDSMRQESDLGLGGAPEGYAGSYETEASDFAVAQDEQLRAASLVQEAEYLAQAAPAAAGEALTLEPDDDLYDSEFAQESLPAQVTMQEVSKASFATTASKTIFARALKDFDSSDAGRRAEGASALSCIHNELSARAILAQLARDPSPEVRGSCVNALTELGLKEGVPAIEKALGDSTSSVRLAAVRGLYTLAGAEKADQLVRMLSDKDEDVRHRAATCVGWLGQRNLSGKLVGLFTDRSPSVRRAAVEAASNLRTRELVSSLIDLLDDPDDSVQRASLNAIETITGKKIAEAFPKNRDARQRLIARWRQWWREETGQN